MSLTSRVQLFPDSAMREEMSLLSLWLSSDEGGRPRRYKK